MIGQRKLTKDAEVTGDIRDNLREIESFPFIWTAWVLQGYVQWWNYIVKHWGSDMVPFLYNPLLFKSVSKMTRMLAHSMKCYENAKTKMELVVFRALMSWLWDVYGNADGVHTVSGYKHLIHSIDWGLHYGTQKLQSKFKTPVESYTSNYCTNIFMCKGIS